MQRYGRVTNLCNCDSRHPDGKDFGELDSMKSLPVTALRYGGALSSTSKMHVQLGSLKCSGKAGIYPSEKIYNWEENQAIVKRLDTMHERLNAIPVIPTKFLPSTLGYSVVKSDFGIVVYKLYDSGKTRSEALNTCTSDASFLHFPQPTNEQENLFYYDLIHPSASDVRQRTRYRHPYGSPYDAIWLDISKSFWSNYEEDAPSSSVTTVSPHSLTTAVPEELYTTMSLKTGERDKNWNRVPTSYRYMFVCTAVFK